MVHTIAYTDEKMGKEALEALTNAGITPDFVKVKSDGDHDHVELFLPDRGGNISGLSCIKDYAHKYANRMKVRTVDFESYDFSRSFYGKQNINTHLLCVALKNGVVGIHNKADINNPVVKCTREEWQRFIHEVKKGTYDL
ncbi:MAG: hypothetical protein AAB706_02795 [Patescibacteria group bacterium]